MRARFVVATPDRSVCDHHARVFQNLGLLRLYAAGTRRGTRGIDWDRTRLNPAIGLAAYATGKLFGFDRGESLRYRLNPPFDHWVKRQLIPGDCILSSYGYANACFEWVRAHGGKTFLDGGNSHPDQFWEILTEEHRRWECPLPPVARHHRERARRMMEYVDYVFAPSSYVADSFLSRQFGKDQILRLPYPVDLSCFTPSLAGRPKEQPLRIVNTGSLSLRKGTPYLLEAFRIVRRTEPGARLVLSEIISESIKPVLRKYADLPIDWAPPMGHEQLAAHLRSCDIFVLPSLEEGLARASLEAMACGLPVVVTPHTGSNDLVSEGLTGSVVPIRNPEATAEAILSWATRIREGNVTIGETWDGAALSEDRFRQTLSGQLSELGFARGQ